MIAKKDPISVALVKTSKRLLTFTVCGFTTAGPGAGAGDGEAQFIPQ
jgi:hypothetical protein